MSRIRVSIHQDQTKRYHLLGERSGASTERQEKRRMGGVARCCAVRKSNPEGRIACCEMRGAGAWATPIGTTTQIPTQSGGNGEPRLIGESRPLAGHVVDSSEALGKPGWLGLMALMTEQTAQILDCREVGEWQTGLQTHTRQWEWL
ncbi:predicted protein [Chaetomium globosum CBS 148.51]|uniref:Uncharacterized protein n=1 Tax=Chaetomium globosum (strain ATCC 6205 / CBS 148.51 / DSM 1962 / NBRC 6347 / NRRL 1970) TaxID=306901 RepID=Q2GWA0_CHAGB|nr:uncharacterized protein CHGG_07754 [Chaetomium globosum CBS 148.51]EAQ86501.1 predicted protein [Chaetomium globosum CBS 148.51]